MAAQVGFEASRCRVELEGGVGVLRLDRPPVNAVDVQMHRELLAAARWISENGDVRSVVIHGGPRMFAAGADVKEMAVMSHQEMVACSALFQASCASLAAIAVPVIAAINGYALGGGCEIALCADIRIVSEKALLGQPEILLGIIPGMGGTQRLSRLVGASRAKDLIFTGRHVGAAEAAAIGLADRVVPDESVLAEAMALATTLAKGAPLALAAAKRSIDQGLQTDLATGILFERAEFAGLFGTDDRRIGMDSFLADGPGKAQFTGS